MELNVIIDSNKYHSAMSELHWVRGFIEGITLDLFNGSKNPVPVDREKMQPALDRMDSALAQLTMDTEEKLI